MYYTDLRQRKVGSRAKELHIATRWSVHDVLGRLERDYEGDPRAKFIKFAALDENDESNFDYPYGLGYSTEALHKQREIMDDPSWRALYMNEPIEREGLLYEPQELRRFFKLPDVEPDTILAICDTKEQGADYCTMPVMYQYGNDFYMDKVIFDNGKVEALEERVAQALVDRKVRMCRIESNRGGTMFAQNVQKRVKELGGMTNITTKWTQTNKATRIQVNSPFVKTHFLFKDESLYNGVGEKGDREYRTAMNFMFSYSMTGKNKFDDVVDVLSLSVEFIRRGVSTRAEVMMRPW
jgi:predicted phage terminase large subunit-like protein